MEFLDRLAEIVCREKLASYVTYTSIIEDGDQVMIVIARSAKWTKTDRKFFEQTCQIDGEYLLQRYAHGGYPYSKVVHC
jgi:hypothetical protein